MCDALPETGKLVIYIRIIVKELESLVNRTTTICQDNAPIVAPLIN